MTRSPYVAGQFYEADPGRLKKQLEAGFLHKLGPGKTPVKGPKGARDIVACISPHAGYMYSGPCAAHVYYELSREKTPARVVVLGTNHTGLGGAASASAEDWVTPLGVAKTDLDAVKKLGVPVDEYAHRYEHSLEVQVPFLQYIYGVDLRLVPIIVSMTSSKGVGIEDRLAGLEDPLIIASSDFTHYEHAPMAKEKDEKAIEAILDMDEERFLNIVESTRASICGYAPIISAIITAKKLGAKKAELLKYTTSGDITGDQSSVVAYAAIVFRK